MEWKDKIGSFRQIDVRGIQGNFFQGIKKQPLSAVPAPSDQIPIILFAVHSAE